MFRSITALLIILAFGLSGEDAHAQEKFALIVGVDDQMQPATYKINILKGPSNDVKLIKRLLVDRQGFKDDPEHILTLTGKNATKNGIADAFRSQLIEKAKTNPGAIVVFYFSGHGSQQGDTNSDEGDGVDETLVAYDSRYAGGQDIIDDEIDEWFQALLPYTPNAIFILDSCHSGTGTRGDAVARELPPNPNGPPIGVVPGGKSPSVQNGWARNDAYTAISGSLAEEQSYEGPIREAGGKVHGYLTWTLDQTLRLNPDLSWRQTIEEVRRGIARYTSVQHPQVEGDIDRLAFGGFGDRAQPYLAIGAQSPTEITVQGGQAQGLAAGTLLAIYDPSAKLLLGDEKKLATARVRAAGVSQSKADFVDKPSVLLPAGAKVSVVTPYFGHEPLLVKLDVHPDQGTTAADKVVLAKVQSSLGDNALVRAAKPGEAWRFAVQKGCLDDTGRLVTGVPSKPLPPSCRTAYYLAGPQTLGAALAWSVPASDTEASAKLANALSVLGRQSALRALSNNSGELDIKLRLLPVTRSLNDAGETRFVDGAPVARQQAALPLGSYFRFEVANNSSEDLWVGILALGTSGSIKLLSPSKTGDKVSAHSVLRTRPVLQALPPSGLETYKLIASTVPNLDFSVLEAPGVARKAGSSPLEWFFSQASSTAAKDTAGVPDIGLNQWKTVELDVMLQSAPPQ